MNFQPLQAFMEHLTAWRIPGNTISVYYENKEVYRYSSGYADVETKRAMTGDELLNIYSCSKPATVVAALQLYERGQFLLDDPLYHYIPEFWDMYVADGNGECKKAEHPITIRNLFTMTAGFSYRFDTPGIQEVRRRTKGTMPTLEVAKAVAKEPLFFEPGTRWGYSMAHDILAAVVEVISGERFCQYVKAHIFSPIGVEELYYHRDDAIRNRMASQYRYQTEETADKDTVSLQISSGNEDGIWVKESKEVSHVLGSAYDSGGAGIVVSVPDYAKFASALANGGIAPNGEKILSGRTIDLMRTNQLNASLLQDFNWSQLRGYGYGLGIRTLIDKASSGSNGSLGEFGWGGAAGATILCDPEQKLAFFYAHHMLNPQEDYYQPRLRNVVYGCL